MRIAARTTKTIIIKKDFTDKNGFLNKFSKTRLLEFTSLNNIVRQISRAEDTKSAKKPEINTINILFLEFTNGFSILINFIDTKSTRKSKIKFKGITIIQVVGINHSIQIGKNILYNFFLELEFI